MSSAQWTMAIEKKRISSQANLFALFFFFVLLFIFHILESFVFLRYLHVNKTVENLH